MANCDCMWQLEYDWINQFSILLQKIKFNEYVEWLKLIDGNLICRNSKKLRKMFETGRPSCIGLKMFENGRFKFTGVISFQPF